MVKDWWIPGMRMLAVLSCTRCTRQFYGDLPAGHGLYYPMLLEASTGRVHDTQGVPWFADSLRDSFARHIDEKVPFEEEELRPIRKPLLLNCLDQLYGHSLLKLAVRFETDDAPIDAGGNVTPATAATLGQAMRFETGGQEICPDGWICEVTIGSGIERRRRRNDYGCAAAKTTARIDRSRQLTGDLDLHPLAGDLR